MDDNEDDEELLKDIPFSTQELDNEYDEDEFMDKLSKHLEQKYNDNDIDDTSDTAIEKDHSTFMREITALDILTMDENELDQIMPIDDADVDKPVEMTQNENPGLPKSQAKQNVKRKPKRKRTKTRPYSKVPSKQSKNKGPKKISKNNRFILAQRQTKGQQQL